MITLAIRLQRPDVVEEEAELGEIEESELAIKELEQVPRRGDLVDDVCLKDGRHIRVILSNEPQRATSSPDRYDVEARELQPFEHFILVKRPEHEICVRHESYSELPFVFPIRDNGYPIANDPTNLVELMKYRHLAEGLKDQAWRAANRFLKIFCDARGS
jgi:hypothetical protein